jgi:uncharacterized repeat protein (TIGR03847 family)
VPRRILVFDDPDRFAAGTVGEPGHRTFFLQAAQGPRSASVALEKVQVALLADRIAAVVSGLERRGLAALDAERGRSDDDDGFHEPDEEDFRVGLLTLAWDDEVDRLVVEARSVTDEEPEADEPDDAITDDDPIGPDILRVRLSPTMAMGFARRAVRVVAAGRPPCPFCGEPLEPTGHLCPRRNGTTRLN